MCTTLRHRRKTVATAALNHSPGALAYLLVAVWDLPTTRHRSVSFARSSHVVPKPEQICQCSEVKASTSKRRVRRLPASSWRRRAVQEQTPAPTLSRRPRDQGRCSGGAATRVRGDPLLCPVVLSKPGACADLIFGAPRGCSDLRIRAACFALTSKGSRLENMCKSKGVTPQPLVPAIVDVPLTVHCRHV